MCPDGESEKFNPNISNLFLKALYSVMLTEFSLEAVREFWKIRNLTLKGERISEEALYRLLWLEGGTLPLEFVQSTVDSVERFCVLKAANVLEIVDKMGLRVNRDP